MREEREVPLLAATLLRWTKVEAISRFTFVGAPCRRNLDWEWSHGRGEQRWAGQDVLIAHHELTKTKSAIEVSSVPRVRALSMAPKAAGRSVKQQLSLYTAAKGNLVHHVSDGQDKP